MKHSDIDWDNIWSVYRKTIAPMSLSIFAEKTGTDPMALCMMDCHWASDFMAWLFPMRNAKSEIIGIRIINEIGHSWVAKSSRNGLYIPNDHLGDKPTYFVQGALEAAKALSHGKQVIGMAEGCEEMAKEYVKINNIKNAVIVANDDYKL